jgi:DNA repair protein RecO (recombination protein O)
MSAPEVTEAICLTVQKYSESSKIAVLYTQRWGRISVMAKGAYRPKSQLWGHLEPLSIAESVVYKKPKEQIYLLSSCRATVPWLPLTGSPERAGYAFAVCEFLYRFSYEEENPEMYPLARAVLVALSHQPQVTLARQFWAFMLAGLEVMGFRPALDTCTTCGRSPETDQSVIFDAAAGRIICRSCREGRTEASRPYKLSPSALAELRLRQKEPILEDNQPPLENGALGEIAAAVEDFARYHLGGAKLKSLDFARRMSAS